MEEIFTLRDKEDFQYWDDYIEWKAYQKKYDEFNKIIDKVDNTPSTFCLLHARYKFFHQ